MCVWVLELGWLAPGSIWSWTSPQLAATQMDRQFCWTWCMNSSVGSSGLSSLLRADFQRVTDTQENLIQQHFLSPDNRMSSSAEEGRNQRTVGNRLSLPQVVEGEGSPLGYTHTHTHAHTHTHTPRETKTAY